MKDRTECRQLDNVEGIRVQNVGDAMLASLHIAMFDRLQDAVGVATERNLMDVEEARETVKELYKHDQASQLTGKPRQGHRRLSRPGKRA